MKKIICITIALSLALFWGVGAYAATTGTGTVSFTVSATQSLTASSLALGGVVPGTNNLGNKQPVTVSSNTAWKVTAQADGDFTGTDATMAISSLTMDAKQMSSGSPVQIATGTASSSSTPGIATVLTVPWENNLAGKSLSATLTYTVAPN